MTGHQFRAALCRRSAACPPRDCGLGLALCCYARSLQRAQQIRRYRRLSPAPLPLHHRSVSHPAMVFSFSFNLSVPGIINPFTAAAEAEVAAANSEQASLPTLHFDEDVLPPSASTVHTRRPASPSILPPVSKKRGWVPSYPEPSRPAPMQASTSGYLDTPAKYRDMVYDTADQEEMEELVAGEFRAS